MTLSRQRHLPAQSAPPNASPTPTTAMSFLPESILNIPGERFEIPFDDSDDEQSSPAQPPVRTPFSFIGDIVEKPTTADVPQPPVLSPTANSTGFPEHRKRARGPSRFKQRASAQQAQARQPPPSGPAPERSERQHISDENDARINAMSEEEIAQEQQELLAKLNPKLVERLLGRSAAKEANDPPEPAPRKERNGTPGLIDSYLKRATIEEQQDSSFDRPGEPARRDAATAAPEPSQPDPVPRPPKKVEFAVDEAAPPIYDPALFPAPDSYHFPVPPSAEHELDPTAPDFLEQLHSKYYPTLAADPSKLSWMAPLSEQEDVASGYHPSLDSLSPAALRFDFKGNLLPPRKALEMPAHLGLHHHAEAPSAAGYTVPELARLARSNVPSQRCVAIQTLGRILYKLGTGVYKVEDITQGLWRCIKEGGVIETLQEAAGGRMATHMSVKAYAEEALWLWQKGGGQQWKAE